MKRLMIVTILAVAVLLATGPVEAKDHGIGTGAAIGLGLGAFGLGAVLGGGAYGYPYYVPGYGYSYPVYPPASYYSIARTCWNPWSRSYYVCYE